jgi:hypothetical protein
MIFLPTSIPGRMWWCWWMRHIALRAEILETTSWLPYTMPLISDLLERLSTTWPKERALSKVFGIDDQRGYLDKYSIAESIDDGTTVQLNYALAPSDLLVDSEVLEKEFLNLADVQSVSDIEELNAILDRAVPLKDMQKAPSRVEKIARCGCTAFPGERRANGL